MAKHKNIPIFIPHVGCPNQCVFCNQKTISGSAGYSIEGVKDLIETALSTVRADEQVEIAFFGGSFTGIDRTEMTALLSIAGGYLQEGRICGIRLSTRPDYISPEILNILSEYGVSDIELGVQSLDDAVLARCVRGHSAAQAVTACQLIKERGAFRLVGQMMLGLPGATKDAELSTAKKLLDLGVDALRIYPTVVLHHTPLADMLANGSYTPLSIDTAVDTAADILEMANDYGVECLRIGLCENEALHQDGGMLAGPFHPAFGEMAISRVFFRQFVKALQDDMKHGDEIVFRIPQGCLSKAIGQKRQNVNALCQIFNLKKIRFTESADLTGYRICLQEDHTIASQIT